MIYSNIEFIVFYLSLLLLYSAIPNYRWRFSLLLIGSLIFYAWAGFADTLIFLFVVFFSWLSAAGARNFPRFKNQFLTLGIVVMLGHLFFWKYAPWVSSQIQLLYPQFLEGQKLVIPLPVGISFFTLQGVAYLIDYRRGEVGYISMGQYLLFKSFFAQLVAGPIVRVKQLLPQLQILQTPNLEDFAVGASLFSLGFLKKIALADKIAPIVDQIFAQPQNFNRGPLLLGVLGYTVQIWADFSGYTDMGRGCARMLGINLPNNFLSPYFSRGPGEFWARWHITLSTWIRDYIYIPLGGNRGSVIKTVGVLFLTMSISGLWHGANWNFLIWGIYHGILLASERLIRPRIQFKMKSTIFANLGIFINWVFVFGLIIFGWLIFRVQQISDIPVFLSGIFGEQKGVDIFYPYAYHNILFAFATCMGVQALFYNKDMLEQPAWFKKLVSNRFLGWQSISLGTTLGLTLALLVILALVFRGQSEIRSFIYFQF